MEGGTQQRHEEAHSNHQRREGEGNRQGASLDDHQGGKLTGSDPREDHQRRSVGAPGGEQGHRTHRKGQEGGQHGQRDVQHGNPSEKANPDQYGGGDRRVGEGGRRERRPDTSGDLQRQDDRLHEYGQRQTTPDERENHPEQSHVGQQGGGDEGGQQWQGPHTRAEQGQHGQDEELHFERSGDRPRNRNRSR